MQATLGELALLVGGEAVGPADLMIQGAASLRDAAAGEITLADSAERRRKLADSQAAAVVCPRSFTPDHCRRSWSMMSTRPLPRSCSISARCGP